MALEWVQAQSRPWLVGVVQMLRKAVAATPGKAGVWERLGTTQRMSGDTAGSLQTLREACALFPDDPALWMQRARSAHAAGEYEEGLAAVEAARRLEPEAVDAAALRFGLLVKMGQLDRAEAALPEVVARDGVSLAVLHFAVGRARARGEWEPLLELCETELVRSPGNTGARYYRALALLRLGRATEAKLDPREFLWVGKLPLPDGEAEAQWLASLRREVLANPTLAADPRGFTTTHGMQTRELLQPGDVALPELCARLRTAVELYQTRLVEADVKDAFVTARPHRVGLTPWAVVYPGEGRQRSHIHAPGWVSGVYYVAAPPGGALLLGAMDEEDVADSDVPWEVVRVQPEPNTLVLFPSFIPHATEATHADELRICVAFDVVPA